MTFVWDESDDERLVSVCRKRTGTADLPSVHYDASGATNRGAGSGGDAEVDAEPVEPGRLFSFLNPGDPAKARDRFGRLYWVAWRRFLQSFFLFMFGVTFLVIGLACMRLCDEFDRGVAFFFIGLLLFLPGAYGSATLLFYVRGYKGYSYKQLPDMD